VLEDTRPATPDEQSAAATFALKREVEELRIKVRILEARRSEDQERLKSVEAKALEADALRAARVKLQGLSLHHCKRAKLISQPNSKNSNHQSPPTYDP